MELELSSQVQQLVEENFKGRSPAEAFTGAKIDLTGKGGEESGIEALQVGGFGAVFTNEPIGVLVRTAHPGRVRRRKEKGNVVQRSGDFVVFGKLLATIRRDGAYQFRGSSPSSRIMPSRTCTEVFLGIFKDNSSLDFLHVKVIKQEDPVLPATVSASQCPSSERSLAA